MVKKIVAMVISIALVISILVGGACSPAETSIQTQTTALQTQQLALPILADAIAKVKPSVVAINVEVMTYDIFNQPTQVEGAGSGWIIDQDGYIVTNNHVVEGANSVIVTLNDGRKFSADDVKTDYITDLAVVKIDASNLPALGIGDSTLLEIGDWAVAVGNALGMGISATAGIVSALDVTLSESADQTLHGLIQTDAAINPGNSGGPLVNMAGEVIGINSVKIAEVGVEGLGYAISINEALPVIQELINTGYVVRPWLGVALTNVNSMVASFYNLAVDTGVLITQVAQNSPAEQAGLTAGDVIAAIDGTAVGNVSDLSQIVNSYEVGQQVAITFWRGQTKNTATLTLGESPPPSQS